MSLSTTSALQSQPAEMVKMATTNHGSRQGHLCLSPPFMLTLQSVMSTYIPPHNKLLKNDEFTSAVYGDSFITLLKESPRQKRAAGTPLNTCSTPFLCTECWPNWCVPTHPSIPFANLLSSYHHTIMTVVYICLCVLYLLLDKWTILDETLHKHCRGHHETNICTMHTNILYKSHNRIYIL